MKIRLILCVLLLLLFSQTALTQDNPVDPEVRFAKIEVTLSHLNEAVRNLNGQLGTIQLTIFGLFAAFFIPIVALIMQIKTQLVALKHDVGILKDQVSGLGNKVDGLENRVDGLEEQVVQNRKELIEHITELSITTQKQLTQIREALAVQLGIVLDPEDKI
ncbi:MAG: hypothetical protein OYL97_20270 [Candidatus Poribacteria bacterium]|nr:hypothetical protein [Candidatus Poribacteria bacterium]